MKIIYTFSLLIVLISISIKVQAESLSISLEIPVIKASPYHRPYIAVWLETPKRKGVHTFTFWAEQSEWFKDLRQWWRKIGRNNTPNYDAVSGATRKPGKYQISWDGSLTSGEKLAPGKYVLHIEAVREQGNREYLRQKITLGKSQQQNYQLQGNTELGSIHIVIQ